MYTQTGTAHANTESLWDSRAGAQSVEIHTLTHTLALMCSEEARTLKLVANCLLKLT